MSRPGISRTLFISEAESSALASPEIAWEAVRQALIDVCNARTESSPVVHGHGSNPLNGFKAKAAAADAVAAEVPARRCAVQSVQRDISITGQAYASVAERSGAGQRVANSL